MARNLANIYVQDQNQLIEPSKYSCGTDSHSNFHRFLTMIQECAIIVMGKIPLFQIIHFYDNLPGEKKVRHAKERILWTFGHEGLP